MNDFCATLLAIPQGYDLSSTRLVRTLASGRAPHKLIARLAARTVFNADLANRYLARLLVIAEDEALSWHLCRQLVEENGGVVQRDGLAFSTEARHLTWAKQFASSVGVSKGDLDAMLATFSPFPEKEEALGNRDWLGASALYFCGIEAMTPAVGRAIIDALKPNCLPEGSMLFYENHIIADEVHGREAVELMAALCDTDDKRTRAIEAARYGAATHFARFNASTSRA